MARRNEWSGEKVVILGLARQGMALARFLVERGARVVISDMQPREKLAEECAALEGLPITYALGGHPESILADADLLCISGGVPLVIPIIAAARSLGIPLSNDAQIFMERCPAPVIGITGSAGKTTTTTLLGKIAVEAAAERGCRAFVGGNIGRPLINDLEEIKPDDFVVMELSSFQLELMTVSPHIAAVLNVTPNHLDRHGTMEAYSAAKTRILKHQTAEDVAILGRDDPGAWALQPEVRGRLLTFGRHASIEEDGVYLDGEMLTLLQSGREQALCNRSDIHLRGEHNLMNVMAACALAAAAGISSDAMQRGIRDFTGVPHRLELVRRLDGVDWYNDSIATTPERSIAAMRSFEQPIVLLAGGRDKNLPWDTFAREAGRRVHHIVLFGEASDKIRTAVEAEQDKPRIAGVLQANDLADAVQAARGVTQAGDVVLLSPGGTSYDAYKDFEERGEHFRRMVKAL